MKIELIDVMGSDLTIVNTARVSFGKWKDRLDDKDVKLINYLASHKHISPFHHPQISLRCEVPIFLARQLGKHQIGLTWNEVSRRYVDDSPEFFYPTSWRSRPDGSVKQGSGINIEHQDSWNDYYDVYLDNCLNMYEQMLSANIAPEQARMALPQSMYTSFIWTGSLAAFNRVYKLRIDPHAQSEARDFAKMLGDVIEPLFPNSWAALNAN